HRDRTTPPTCEPRQVELTKILDRVGLLKPADKKTQRPRSDDDEAARVAEALRHVPGVDEYHQWLIVGMCLHAWDAQRGFDLWCSWSSASGKYDETTCRAKWRSFRHDGGLTIGTVFKLA